MRARLPLLLPAIGWVAGIAALRADLIPLSAWLWLLMALLGLACLGRWRPFALAALLGLLWGGAALFWDARMVSVDDSWLATDVTVNARVIKVQAAALPKRLLLADVVDASGNTLKGRAVLYVYSEAASLPLPGQRIRVQGRWRKPRNFANPGAFDYRAYCFDRHIALIGHARSAIEVLDQRQSWWQAARTRVMRLLANLPAAEAGVLHALILGQREAVPSDLAEAFAASGAAHLLAISGLHVGMVASWAFFLCWWLLTRRQAWIVQLPVRRLCLAAGATAAGFYATLAGWPLPTQRAVLMLAAAVLAWWLRTRTQPLNTLLFALMLILAWDPQAVASASLWLSFVAAGALIAWSRQRQPIPERRRLGNWLMGVLWVSLIAGLATLPLIAHLFERIPTYSLPVNLLLVPWYAVAVLPCALAGAILAVCAASTPAAVLLSLAGAGAAWANSLLLTVQDWPAARLWIAEPPMWIAIVYIAGMVGAALLYWRQRFAAAGLAATLSLLVYLAVVLPERPPQHAVWAAWDVGQGAASSLMLPQGFVLCADAPGRYGSRFNGGSTAAAALRAMGLVHVDVLVLTHAQQDHIGGAWRFMDGLNHVRELWLADTPINHRHDELRRLRDRVERAGGHVRWLKRGDEIDVGRAHLTVLWPPAGLRPANANNASLVLSVSVGAARLLLPADIEAEAESAIVAGGLSRHDIGLMPHHGSITSSTPAWVSALAPEHAVAQTGLRNRYGFPRPEVVERYRRQGSRVYNTAGGAVAFALAADGGKPILARQYQEVSAGNRARALQWWQAHL